MDQGVEAVTSRACPASMQPKKSIQYSDLAESENRNSV